VSKTKIEDVYTIIDKLGRGSFGYVVLAQIKNIKSPTFESVVVESSKRRARED
jgi:serine/threonine protein kinase